MGTPCFVCWSRRFNAVNLGTDARRAELVHIAGGPLLHYALPPALEEMERLRQEDAVNGELAACEGALAHLLHLLAATLSASAMFGHELPLEEWLFHVGAECSWCILAPVPAVLCASKLRLACSMQTSSETWFCACLVISNVSH